MSEPDKPVATPYVVRRADRLAYQRGLLWLVASRKIFLCLCILTAVVVAVVIFSFVLKNDYLLGPFLPIFGGSIGGMISLHKRLRDLDSLELKMIEQSWVWLILPCFVGGLLAFLLYMLFMSGLLSGVLFPRFTEDPSIEEYHKDSIFMLWENHTDFHGYAKLIFWSFVAGYSEGFVLNILGQLAATARQEKKALPPESGDGE